MQLSAKPNIFLLLWQRRFWEHQIRDEQDVVRPVDYIHYNPVSHGLVAAQKDRYGETFNTLYTNLLRDTGSMTAEALVQTHLNQDIRQPEFWQASLDIADRSVSRLEALAAME